MEGKIYNFLKFSYKSDGGCFLPGMYAGNAMNLDQLLDLIERHLTSTGVKEAWLPEKEFDDHLFFVTYDAEFEQGFKHGFKVQVIDTGTSKSESLSKYSDPEAWNAVRKLVSESQAFIAKF